MKTCKNIYNNTAEISVFSTYPRLITNEGRFVMTDFIIKPKSKNFQDLTGQKFNRLLVIDYAGKADNGGHKWKCQCDCGSIRIVYRCGLKSGATKSCGCLHSEQMSKRLTIHGGAGYNKTPEYGVWSNMIARCNNPKHKAYKNYGGRGIFVSDSWRDFNVFLADMGRRPSPKHSLDRINNNLGYSRENCKWATWDEQNRNKRNNCLLTLNMVTLSLPEWATKIGIKKSTLASRIHKGWSDEECLSTPVYFKRGARCKSK